MEADPQKRLVAIAPHLWRALEVMARDVAVEPTSLVNQAVFAWLRINGYVLPGTATQPRAAPRPSQPRPPQRSSPSSVPPAPKPITLTPTPAPPSSSSSSPLPAPLPAPPPKTSSSAAALEGVVARVDEIEADLARFARPTAPQSLTAPTPVPSASSPELRPRPGSPLVLDAPEFTSPVPAPPGMVAKDRELLLDAPEATSAPIPRFEPKAEEGTFVLKVDSVVAYVQREGEPRVQITGDRFIIGRGPQCDLIIDSPRVSREHVALVRSGLTYVLEDLGSSNGTFFNDEKIDRRELESGDVIRLGNERVTFFLFDGKA